MLSIWTSLKICGLVKNGGLYHMVELFTKRQILQSSTWKALADNLHNAATLLSDRIGKENVVGKGEIDGYKHFFILQQCFQSFLYQDSLNLELGGINVPFDIILDHVILNKFVDKEKLWFNQI